MSRSVFRIGKSLSLNVVTWCDVSMCQCVIVSIRLKVCNWWVQCLHIKDSCLTYSVTRSFTRPYMPRPFTNLSILVLGPITPSPTPYLKCHVCRYYVNFFLSLLVDSGFHDGIEHHSLDITGEWGCGVGLWS